MSDIEILIIEGNTESKNAEIRAQGGREYAHLYRAVLQQIAPDATCRVLRPCESDLTDLAMRIDLSAIGGAVWTGSSLSVLDSIAPVTAQVSLFADLFEAGIPIFGSCWGLQVMAVALGGKVRRNPLGREIGVAREITLTDAGVAHPMYADKPPIFDSIAMHIDEVESLPSECSILAGNAHSPIQAAAMENDARSFWGVQYHPEFDLEVLALGIRRVAPELIDEGFFATSTELEAVCDSLASVERAPQVSRARRSVYGIRDSVAVPEVRRREIANWFQTVVRRRD